LLDARKIWFSKAEIDRNGEKGTQALYENQNKVREEVDSSSRYINTIKQTLTCDNETMTDVTYLKNMKWHNKFAALNSRKTSTKRLTNYTAREKNAYSIWFTGC